MPWIGSRYRSLLRTLCAGIVHGPSRRGIEVKYFATRQKHGRARDTLIGSAAVLALHARPPVVWVARIALVLGQSSRTAFCAAARIAAGSVPHPQQIAIPIPASELAW